MSEAPTQVEPRRVGPEAGPTPGPGRFADRTALVAGGGLVVALLVLLGPGLVGAGSFGPADHLLNFDPWRATAPADAEITRAPVSDIIDARLPRLHDWGEGLRNGEMRLWNPYPAGGTGQHVDAFAPTEVPYAFLPAGRATAWATLIGVVVSIAGSIAFLRAVGLSKLAAVGGASVYAFTGFQVAWTLWPQSHVGALVPVLFWAVERQVQRPGAKSTAAVALATAWILIEGFPAVAVVAAGCAGLYGLARTMLDHAPSPVRRRVIAGAAAGAVLGVALAAVALLPLGALLDRGEFTRDSLAGLNSEPFEAVTLVSPDALGPPDGPHLGPINAIETTAFVGAGALVLVILAAAARRPPGRRGVRAVTLGAAVAIAALIFVDGPHVDLAARLPVLDFNPLTRLRSLLGFAVAVGAALGIDVLHRGHSWSGRRFLMISGGGAVVALLCLRELDRYRDDTGAAVSLADAVERPLIVGVAVVVGILVSRRSPRIAGPAAVAIVLVLVLDGASFASGWWRTTPDDRFYPNDAAHELLDQRLGGDRFAGTGGSLATGTGTYYGHRELTGNVGHTAAWADLLRAVDPDVFATTTYSRLPNSISAIESPILDRLAVRYVSYPVGTVVGTPIPPARPSDSVTVAAASTTEAAWPGPRTGAVVFVATADVVSSDPFAEVVVEVLDTAGEIVARGNRRVFSGIPAGELAVPVTTPNTAADRVRVRLDTTDGVALSLGTQGDAVPVTGSVVLPDDVRVVLADGLTLVERATSLPRIRWATDAIVIGDAEERVASLAAGIDDGTVLLSDPGAAGTGREPTSLEIIEDGAERIVVEISASGAGYLVIADAIEESWRVRIDGEPAELVTADHAGVAVMVAAGTHRVVVTHERGAFGIGLAVSLAALAVTVGLLLAGTSRERLVRVALLLLGLVTVVVITVIGWRSLESPPDEIRLAPLAVLGLIVLISYVVVSVEFHLAGRILGVAVDAPQALITTTVATVANLLPLPGAAITRVIVLRRRGAPATASVRVLAVIGGLWLGLSLLAAGFGIAPARGWIAAAMIVVGLAITGTSWVLMRREGCTAALVAALVATEAIMIALGATRILLALRGLDLDGSIGEVVSVGVSAPLSAAVGFVPAGLGVRESIAVVLGALSGLGGAEAGVAAALDRTVGLIALIPAAALAFALRRRGIGT